MEVPVLVCARRFPDHQNVGLVLTVCKDGGAGRVFQQASIEGLYRGLQCFEAVAGGGQLFGFGDVGDGFKPASAMLVGSRRGGLGGRFRRCVGRRRWGCRCGFCSNS